MEFVQETSEKKETIAAIATPAGEGAISAIRLSGDDAFSIVATLLARKKTSFVSHKAILGEIVDREGKIIDSVLLLPFKGPRSYTGEDTVEIFCHGGSLITKKVLQQVLFAGARHARPGEFTFRAFMNGKIDLSQAEAVQSLISARNEKMCLAASEQLKGRLSEKVKAFQEELSYLTAIMEVFLDFPEEDLDQKKLLEMEQIAGKIYQELVCLSSTYHEGRLIHEGMRVALVGAPNAGKSSLMNLLLQKSRSIVSDIPGTTRDTIEEGIRLFGIHLLLIDTAGIRSSLDPIEEEGVRRSWEAVSKSDLILHLIDSTAPELFLEKLPLDKTLLIWNKRDLVPEDPFLQGAPHQTVLSCLNREGLDVLLQKMEKMIFAEKLASQEEIILTEARHKEALDEAIRSMEKVLEGLQNQFSLEFVALEVREALHHLGKIIGINVSEEILTTLFNKFCIGK